MYFSGKISNAFLTYLEDQGMDLNPLLEEASLSESILKNPSSWISAPDLENFFELYSKMTSRDFVNRTLQEAGHQGYELFAWGVLDSVLKMMPTPQDAFLQIQRFLSYFISPEPPIEQIERSPFFLKFALPLMAEQYPLVTVYLKSAFEGIPKYSGQDLAKCQWKSIYIQIEWPRNGEVFLNLGESRQVNPELLQNVVEQLQKNQQELEAKNRELQLKNEELLSTHTLPPPTIQENSGALSKLLENQVQHHNSNSDRVYLLTQNLAKLHDYMVRAQQLITILSAHVQMKDVYKKLDWENVKIQYPRTISKSVELLRSLHKEAPLDIEPQEELILKFETLKEKDHV